jgi:hypothetical protein
MAIQVNGTTVINNSRALQNIASVDATTVAALGAAGVGGAATWQTLGTFNDSSTRVGNYQSGTTAVTLPSTGLKAFGFRLDMDALINNSSATNTYRIKILFSATNSFSSDSVEELYSWNSTSGYFPSANTWHDLKFSRVWGINSEAYDTASNSTTSILGSNPVGLAGHSPYLSYSNSKLIWNGFFGPSFPSNPSNFPAVTPNTTLYIGYHLNYSNTYSGAHARNVNIKAIGLY